MPKKVCAILEKHYLIYLSGSTDKFAYVFHFGQQIFFLLNINIGIAKLVRLLRANTHKDKYLQAGYNVQSLWPACLRLWDEEHPEIHTWREHADCNSRRSYLCSSACLQRAYTVASLTNTHQCEADTNLTISLLTEKHSPWLVWTTVLSAQYHCNRICCWYLLIYCSRHRKQSPDELIVIMKQN